MLQAVGLAVVALVQAEEDVVLVVTQVTPLALRAVPPRGNSPLRRLFVLMAEL
jgi:hypothetical protein